MYRCNDRERSDDFPLSLSPSLFLVATHVAMKSPPADQSESWIRSKLRAKKTQAEIINEISQYTAGGISIRDYIDSGRSTDESNDSDRSSRRPLLRGTVNGRPPLFSVSGDRCTGVGRAITVRQKNRSEWFPSARYTSHLCFGSAYGPDSYSGATSILPPRARASGFFPSLFLSYRCLSVLFKDVDTYRGLRASFRGLREEGETEFPPNTMNEEGAQRPP